MGKANKKQREQYAGRNFHRLFEFYQNMKRKFKWSKDALTLGPLPFVLGIFEATGVKSYLLMSFVAPLYTALNILLTAAEIVGFRESSKAIKFLKERRAGFIDKLEKKMKALEQHESELPEDKRLKYEAFKKYLKDKKFITASGSIYMNKQSLDKAVEDLDAKLRDRTDLTRVLKDDAGSTLDKNEQYIFLKLRYYKSLANLRKLNRIRRNRRGVSIANNISRVVAGVVMMIPTWEARIIGRIMLLPSYIIDAVLALRRFIRQWFRNRAYLKFKGILAKKIIEELPKKIAELRKHINSRFSSDIGLSDPEEIQREAEKFSKLEKDFIDIYNKFKNLKESYGSVFSIRYLFSNKYRYYEDFLHSINNCGNEQLKKLCGIVTHEMKEKTMSEFGKGCYFDISRSDEEKKEERKEDAETIWDIVENRLRKIMSYLDEDHGTSKYEQLIYRYQKPSNHPLPELRIKDMSKKDKVYKELDEIEQYVAATGAYSREIIKSALRYMQDKDRKKELQDTAERRESGEGIIPHVDEVHDKIRNLRKNAEFPAESYAKHKDKTIRKIQKEMSIRS